MEEKPKFVNRTKWHIPRHLVVITRKLCNREFQKIRQWLDNKEAVEILTDSKNRLVLLNRSKIEKLRTKESVGEKL